MSKITQKFSAIALGVTMAVSFASTAGAQSSADLQAQIAALLAQISTLQEQLNNAPVSSYTFTRDLTEGSTGADVTALQNVLIAGGFLKVSATGYFGPLTKAAVAAWQASVGISPAAGYFGPISRAKLNASAPAPVGPFPAGCTSSTGFSTTTGMPCAGATYPAGCTSSVGFSPTTGQPCSGASTPVTSGPLQGGAGDIVVSPTSVDTESEVAEGATEKVLGFRVEAQDSDVQLTNLKVTVTNTNAPISNRRPDRYLSAIEIWMGNVRVGTIDPSDMTRDGNDYSRNVTLSNAVVREGLANRATFFVVFKALSNIDSADMATATFTVEVTNIRFADASGAIMTSGATPDVSGIKFIDPASAGDVRLRASLGSNNPAEGIVEVNEFSSTSGVLLLEFRLKAEGTDMKVSTITVDLTSTTADLADILADLRLMRGNTVLADVSSFAAATTDSVEFELYDDLAIKEDSTVTLRVVAKLKKQNGNFANGETLRASLDTTGIDAENNQGNPIGSFPGSASGNVQTLFVEGANIVYVSSTSTQVDNDGKVRDFVLVFDVTAIGTDVQVDRSVFNDGGTPAQDAMDVDFTIVGTGANTGSPSLTSNASRTGDIYTVYEGQTRRFTLTVTVTTDTTGQKRIVLTDVAEIAPSTTVESVSATVIQ